MRTLADLQPSEKAYIITINDDDDWIQRLMTMGMVEGAEVEYISRAFGNGPVEFKIEGNLMAIDIQYAKKFVVEL